MNGILKHARDAGDSGTRRSAEYEGTHFEKHEVSSLKGVLVALDFNSESERALDFAISLLQNSKQANLYLLHALASRAVVSGEESPETFLLDLKLQEERLQEARRKMDEKVHFAKAHGISRVKGLVVESDPVSAIVETAETLKADMIILGNRRRGYRRGIIFGSVSERVAADSPMSVLIVR